ncbi:LOW QUALITY PROTEIN: claudin-34 [Leucoraja erinacea]|uniref:LOW QUALITY PROTEIN: claudin-34 n=1 Tax=Leucoraja erinaceus TaxID=7782 RepID=UPI002454EF80|nr:LOW QUALITY PROTEIN: claudin-34 [Leucoraja erinacea]
MGQRPSGAQIQLLGFVLGAVGWIGAAIAMGLVQWRVWHVRSAEVDSGVAWVGIWRACLCSNRLASPPLRVMSCQAMGAGEAFVPWEIAAAQPLMGTAVVAGALGKAAAVSGLWRVYLGRGCAGLAMRAAGCFHLLAGVCAIIPAGWNLSSVTGSRSITFPPRFGLPSSPQPQEVGAGIYVAIFSSGLLLLAGLLLLSYKTPVFFSNNKVHPSALDPWDRNSLVSGATILTENRLHADSFSEYSLASCGTDNPAFRTEEC